MNKKLLSSTLLLALTMSTSMVLAASNFNYATPQPTYNNNNSLQGYALYVPAGVTCNAVLSQGVDSLNTVVGQNVNAVLMEDFVHNGQLIAASGSTIMGTVVENKKAGFGNRNAKMQIRFTTIRTPYNNIIPISAVIATSDSTGVLRGGTAMDSAKEYARDTVIGAGSGAALGTAMGALSGGSVGRGAIYGTAVGAGIGLLKRTIDKGENISIPANSTVSLLFQQPITITAQ